MTGLTYLLTCLLYFACVGLDIAIFFLQIRLILLWKTVNWLVPFDTSGKPVTDMLTAQLPRLIKTRQPLSERGMLITALIITALFRIILGSLINIK